MIVVRKLLSSEGTRSNSRGAQGIHKQIELLIYFTVGIVFVLLMVPGILGTPDQVLYVIQAVLPVFIPVLAALSILRWVYGRRVPGGNSDIRWGKVGPCHNSSDNRSVGIAVCVLLTERKQLWILLFRRHTRMHLAWEFEVSSQQTLQAK